MQHCPANNVFRLFQPATSAANKWTVNYLNSTFGIGALKRAAPQKHHDIQLEGFMGLLQGCTQQLHLTLKVVCSSSMTYTSRCQPCFSMLANDVYSVHLCSPSKWICQRSLHSDTLHGYCTNLRIPNTYVCSPKMHLTHIDIIWSIAIVLLCTFFNPF